MTVALKHSENTPQPNPSSLRVVDCDIHPVPRNVKDLFPFVEKRWQDYFETFGALRRQGPATGVVYPKGQPDAARLDAWPPEGGRPGSSLAYMQQQHLDPNNVEVGILTTISPHPGNYQNPDLATVFCRAVNEWQVTEWTSKDRRLKGSIMVPYEHAHQAVAEIDLLAENRDFAQIFMLSRTNRPMGDRAYWPLYEAAARAGLPVGVHAFGNSGYPVTPSGWPSYYIEEMAGHAQTCQSQLISLVFSGVFERFPTLRIVFIESGFAWLPSLAWRMDKSWKTLKAETPHLKRLPSEYIRDHLWLTTQPMEEAEKSEHLIDVIDVIGWDRLLFSSDYPHWDFDDPAKALPIRATPEQRARILYSNAAELYGLNG